MADNARGSLCWSIAKSKQDESDDDSADSQADTHLLKRPETAPIACSEEVDGDDTGDADYASSDDEETELTFRDH